MKIFVSSLISGFEPFRRAARSAIQSLGYEPVMAEDFGATPASPQVACLQGLRSADLVLLILGERYGAVPAGCEVSPTHEEYLEARDSKPILLFVQEGVIAEPCQTVLLTEAQSWRGGLFRDGFRNAEELRNRVTRAIHRFELADAAASLDVRELQVIAETLLAERPRESGQGSASVRFGMAAGPRQRVLRPAELESESLRDALHQQAMFGSPRLFERSAGVDYRIEGDALFLEQRNGAGLRLDEWGSLVLGLPLASQNSRSRGFGDLMLGIVEESVLRELEKAIAFGAWIIDRIDATQRLTHVALAARIEAPDFVAWRTQAEHDASPNSAVMRMGSAPGEPVSLNRPRGAMKFDARRLAEDLLVSLRRQWKA